MRFLVTGGRDFNDKQLVHATFSHIPAISTLVHGACRGADLLCAQVWGKEFGLAVEAYPANWPVCEGANCRPEHRKKNSRGEWYCPTAGHLRNQKMIEANIDILYAFPGNTGTADCVKRATKAGIEIIDLRNF